MRCHRHRMHGACGVIDTGCTVCRFYYDLASNLGLSLDISRYDFCDLPMVGQPLQKLLTLAILLVARTATSRGHFMQLWQFEVRCPTVFPTVGEF
jgi:hypothetical protein